MNYVQYAERALRYEVEISGHTIDDVQARLYTLLVLTRGEQTTLADVHDAWAVGRNLDRPEHADLVPFGELLPGVAAYDIPFRDAIHAATRRIAIRTAFPGQHWAKR